MEFFKDALYALGRVVPIQFHQDIQIYRQGPFQ